MSEFKDRLELMLKEKGMKKKELAEALSISPFYISKLCKGTRTLSKQTAALIEEKYGVRAEWLLNGIGEMYSPVKEMTISEKREDLIRRLEGKSDEQVRAVLDFLDLLEETDRRREEARKNEEETV